ncbi:MAG: helix-turn-helix transcriptional regulator [Terriglobia bacterium]
MFVFAAELAQLIGVSRETLLAMSQRGQLPQPVRIGGRHAWGRSTIENWLRERTTDSQLSPLMGINK